MKLSVIVLAAGRGRRFGGDKLRADLDGRPVIARVLDGLRHFDFHERLAIVRSGQSIAGVRTIENLRAADGMGTSLALGIASLGECDGAFVVLGDMPFLPTDIFAELAQYFAQHDIVVPRHSGQSGHPVLFAKTCFADLQKLSGDRGGRALVEAEHYRVGYVDVASDGILRDIDVPEDL